MEKLKDVYKQYVSKVCLIKSEILRICFVYEYFSFIVVNGNINRYLCYLVKDISQNMTKKGHQ